MAFLVLYSIQSVSYLDTPVDERYLLKEMDSLYSPSGLYGHGVGFVAALLMFLLWLYIIRKRWNRLRGIGRLSQWLKYHMWFGIVAPLLAGYHSAFKFEGLIGVMYWAMVAVMLMAMTCPLNARDVTLRIIRLRQIVQVLTTLIMGLVRIASFAMARPPGNPHYSIIIPI